MLPILKHFLNRIHDKLQRGQALLAVNHDPALDRCSREVRLLKHYRTHEMGLSGSFADDRLRQVLNVLPERLPLIVLPPNVPPLECGNLVVDRMPEKALRMLWIGFHVVVIFGTL